MARALGTAVEELAVERIATSARAEIDRITWRGPHGSGRLLFKRMHRAASLEAGLLPFLSRRRLPVERVVSSGIPPAHVREPRPWVLTLEPEGAPLCAPATRESARLAGEALATIQRATRGDAGVLTALGVPTLSPSRIRDEAPASADLLGEEDAARLRSLSAGLDVSALDALGLVLVHGAYDCARVLVAEGRPVALDWSRAHLGCPLEDVARLHTDLARRGAAIAQEFLEGYGEDVATLGAARILGQLFDVRWLAWEASEGLRAREESAALVRTILHLSGA